MTQNLLFTSEFAIGLIFSTVLIFFVLVVIFTSPKTISDTYAAGGSGGIEEMTIYEQVCMSRTAAKTLRHFEKLQKSHKMFLRKTTKNIAH